MEEDKFIGVKSVDEVIENIRRYNSNLNDSLDEFREELIRLMPKHRHWYYIDDLDLFGPSKFIGYKEMDACKYVNKHGKGANGGRTETILKEKLGFLIVYNAEVRSKLENFLANYGKFPNKIYKVSVLPSSKFNSPM